MRRRLPRGARAFGAALALSAGMLMLAQPAPARDAPLPIPQWAAAFETPAAPSAASGAAVRGRALVIAGDCVSCHTREGHEVFSGGLALNTPFGAIYSANITPDSETGIGAWNSDQFYRALHEGRRADGAHLYPAFPYTSFTRVTRADSDDILAYLQTLAPVAYVRPRNQIVPGANIRAVLALWNGLFFHSGEFRPEPARAPAWNRGAYLVEGLGHCSACHTPRNLLGAERQGEALRGGRLENWHAANLAGDLHDGLGAWSVADISEYLRTGRNARAAASGMMGQVVLNSTSQMSEEDRTAIAIYLHDLPARPSPVGATPASAALASGAAVYALHCSACHGVNGEGVAHMFPPLAGDAALQARDVTTIVRIVIEGTRAPMTAERPTPSAMPSFGWALSDEEIAAVLTYLRVSHTNDAAPVRAGDVARVRRTVHDRP